MGNTGKTTAREIGLLDRGRIRIGICLFCCLFVLPCAHAFKLTPITKEFAPSGREANQTFQLENDSDKVVAVQVSMLTREMQLDGSEDNAPADDEFVVYPSQILLQPNQVQTIRVQWAGPDQLEEELSYRILAEQLPVDFSREPLSGAQINVIIRYLGSVYIVPKGARSDVNIESVTAIAGENDEDMLEIIFHNKGTSHAILRDLQLTLKAGSRVTKLGPEALEGIAGENLLAGAKRRFTLLRPDNLPGGPVEIDFEFHRRR